MNRRTECNDEVNCKHVSDRNSRKKNVYHQQKVIITAVVTRGSNEFIKIFKVTCQGGERESFVKKSALE
jgi:hypothetical protein